MMTRSIESNLEKVERIHKNDLVRIMNAQLYIKATIAALQEDISFLNRRSFRDFLPASQYKFAATEYTAKFHELSAKLSNCSIAMMDSYEFVRNNAKEQDLLASSKAKVMAAVVKSPVSYTRNLFNFFKDNKAEKKNYAKHVENSVNTMSEVKEGIADYKARFGVIRK